MDGHFCPSYRQQPTPKGWNPKRRLVIPGHTQKAAQPGTGFPRTDFSRDEGCRLFEQDGRIHFHHSPPDKLPNVDIVLVKNALEYVDDYAGVLKTLCAYRATWFLFLELFAGDFPTYASAQLNMPGTVMPCWFTNANEIIGIMEQCGYALIFEGVMDERVNQDNFPEEFRLPAGRPSMMLFALPHSGGAQQEPVSELR